MVKKIIIPIVAAVMAAVVAVGAALIVKNSQFGMWYEGINGKYSIPYNMVVGSKYYGDGIDLARNKRELNDLVGDKYDETYGALFFATKSLIVVEFDTDGYSAYWLKDVYREKNELVVEISKYSGGQGTGMSIEARFLIAVNKIEIAGVNETTMIMIEEETYEK